MRPLLLQEALMHWVLQCIQVEKQLEIYRETLAEHPESHPLSLFRILDRLGNGYLCCSDFRRCVGLRLPSLRNYVAFMFALWDRGAQGKLCYKDFAECVLPLKNQKLSRAVMQRQEPEPWDWVEDLLIRLLEIELTGMKDLEELKKRVCRDKAFSLSECFKCLGGKGTTQLTVQQLHASLRK